MSRIFYLMTILFLAFLSCKKEKLFTDSSASLGFSDDTITFDTVFSNVGTTTAWLKVYNPYDKPVEISSIRLGMGASSFFRLNIDGLKSYEIYGKRLEKKDSLYIFIEATIDPNNSNSPLLINDSIIFLTNGNTQYVRLNAWGQDVHLFDNKVIGSQEWIADKPYLVYGNLVVNEDEELKINPGAKVYLHRNASMVILGTLTAIGDSDNPIVFQGDRLEELYKEIPGQWGTIVLLPPSKNNVVDNVIIKNSIAGLQIGQPDTASGVDILIKNTRILNPSFAGVLSYDSYIRAYNVIVGEAEYFAVSLLKGGDYEFYHCTFANTRGGFSGKSNPLIYLSNYVRYDEYDLDLGEVVTRDFRADLKNAYFANTIIHDGAKNNLLISDESSHQINYLFENSAISLNEDTFDITDETYFKNCVINETIKFIEEENDNEDAIFDMYTDYKLDTLSPAKDKAEITIVNDRLDLLEFDINANSRVADGKPDMGAIERIE